MPVAGQERIANTTTLEDQIADDIVALAGGGWVVLWEVQTEEVGDEQGLFMQRYDRNGQAVGTERTVSPDVGSSGSMTALDDGGWLVTWFEGDALKFARFNSDGVESLTGELADTTGWVTDVTALSDGGWVCGYGTSDGPRLVRFDAFGQQVGEIEVLSTQFFDISPYLASTADGGWIVTWTAYLSTEFWQVRYDHDGNASDPHRLNTRTTGTGGDTPIAVLPDDGWMVAWKDRLDGHDRIMLQRFSAEGEAVGENLVVEEDIDPEGEYSFSPMVVALTGGGWVVGWVRETADLASEDVPARIYCRRYDADGFQVGGLVEVSYDTGLSGDYARMTALADGG